MKAEKLKWDIILGRYMYIYICSSALEQLKKGCYYYHFVTLFQMFVFLPTPTKNSKTNSFLHCIFHEASDSRFSLQSVRRT